MDSFELNKVMGAVLGTLLFAMGLNVFSTVIYTPKRPAVPGYDLPSAEPSVGAGASDQQAQAEPLPIRLASADVAKGQSAAKKCLACHSFDKGGPNKIGPNLWEVVERGKGSHAGFAYSAALKGKGGNWTFDDLDAFIANPKGYVAGTIMAFAGVSSPKERADVIKYLDSLADNPVPLPTPTAAQAATPAGPAPSPAQTEQRPSPPLPGQRVEPGPAATQAAPQPAATAPAVSQPVTGDTPRPLTQPPNVPPAQSAPVQMPQK